MVEIVVIAHDIRSTHNVGSLLRTCEGLGINGVFFTGYSPYPQLPKDLRMPHIARKLTSQIHKTALGAENTVHWEQSDNVVSLIGNLKTNGFTVVALEQSPDSIPLPKFAAPAKVVLLLGREVEGIESDLLQLCDWTVEIPMFGKKESFNVVQAAAMALYQIRFSSAA